AGPRTPPRHSSGVVARRASPALELTEAKRSAANRVRDEGEAPTGGGVPAASSGGLAGDAPGAEGGRLLQLLDLHARPRAVRLYGGRGLRRAATPARRQRGQ